MYEKERQGKKLMLHLGVAPIVIMVDEGKGTRGKKNVFSLMKICFSGLSDSDG